MKMDTSTIAGYRLIISILVASLKRLDKSEAGKALLGLIEKTNGLEPNRARIVIVQTGSRWYVRRLDRSVHDMDRDEMIYFCDKPLINNQPTLSQALVELNILQRSKSNGRSRRVPQSSTRRSPSGKRAASR